MRQRFDLSTSRSRGDAERLVGRPRAPNVDMWVSQQENSPKCGYFSAAPSLEGRTTNPDQPPLGLVPVVFRGHKPQNHVARSPEGVVAPHPGATYRFDCGVLQVLAARHTSITGHGEVWEDVGSPNNVAPCGAAYGGNLCTRPPAWPCQVRGQCGPTRVPTEEKRAAAAQPGYMPPRESPHTRPDPEKLLCKQLLSCEAVFLQPNSPCLA